MFRFGLITATMIGAINVGIFAQMNLVANGDFLNGSTSWTSLGVYGDAQATAGVTDGAYVVSIQNPGSEAWYVQCTQSAIKLDSGGIYSFSFDASASASRTVEADIEMNGGAYTSYSGIDTVRLSGDMQRFSVLFVMRARSDTNARVTFNCGKQSGNVTIDNISIQKITAPTIKLLTPAGGEQLSKGLPINISWISVGEMGTLTLEFSTDNGGSWQVLSDHVDNTGSFQWTVAGSYSPWCLFRLSSTTIPSVMDVSMAPFEIIPSRELIRNGYFTDGASQWSLGVYGGKAMGMAAEGNYTLAIDTPGAMSWQIQLTQSGISLAQGKTYVLSFAASASVPCTVNVNVGMSGGAYASYLDTSKSNVALTATQRNYSIEFPMTLASDTNARVEFNCGLAKSTVYIDKISLTEKTIARVAAGRSMRFSGKGVRRPFIMNGLGRIVKTGVFSRGVSGTFEMVDVRGRRVGNLLLEQSFGRMPASLSPGVYVAKPGKR